MEPEQPKGDLFSSMKNQMSSWLSKKETKEGGTEEQPEPIKEQSTDEPAEVEPESRVEDVVENEGDKDKEGFGSGRLRQTIFYTT